MKWTIRKAEDWCRKGIDAHSRGNADGVLNARREILRLQVEAIQDNDMAGAHELSGILSALHFLREDMLTPKLIGVHIERWLRANMPREHWKTPESPL